jgi:hypothetical protein
MQADVDVIRIGLQADEGLNVQTVLAGCWHPSLGQIVRSRLYGDLLCQMIAPVPESLPVTVRCHPKRVSDVIGLAKANLERSQLRGRDVVVVSDDGLAEEELRVAVNEVLPHPPPNLPLEGGGTFIYKGNITTDLHYSIHEV